MFSLDFDQIEGSNLALFFFFAIVTLAFSTLWGIHQSALNGAVNVLREVMLVWRHSYTGENDCEEMFITMKMWLFFEAFSVSQGCNSMSVLGSGTS